ncbi:MAG: hypothetical protein IPK97_08295 [Ahniella sp.]|nr:hypothetical protein [Ahniella sp.]
MTGQQLNWYVMKLNGSNGSNGWAGAHTYNHTQNGNDEPRALSFVQDGAARNIVVVGQITTTLGNGGRVVKLNASTGALMWQSNQESAFQEYSNVFTSADGDIFAVGYTNGFNGALATKYNVGGTQVWSVTSVGPGAASFTNWGNGRIDAASGDLIVSGLAQGSGNNNDIAVARFRDTDGVRLWQTLINSPINGSDNGNAIDVDTTHAYIGTGSYASAASATDIFLARLNLSNGLYDAGNGGWTATFTGDDATTFESLSNLRVVGGTVYAAGSTRFPYARGPHADHVEVERRDRRRDQSD